ncbi:546_t:CDS:1, partial [Racocetra fulgida]
LQMSQLHTAMNHCNNLKAIKNSIKKFKNNIQLLLPSSDNSEILTNSVQINQDDTMIISNSEDEEAQEQERNNNAMSIEERNKIVSKWTAMIYNDVHIQSEKWDQSDFNEFDPDE